MTNENTLAVAKPQCCYKHRHQRIYEEEILEMCTLSTTAGRLM